MVFTYNINFFDALITNVKARNLVQYTGHWLKVLWEKNGRQYSHFSFSYFNLKAKTLKREIRKDENVKQYLFFALEKN
jgi:hypothetical protein